MSRRPSEARVAQPRKEADTGKGGAGVARGNPQPPCWGRVHYGLIKFAGETYQGSHKPLISKDLFDQCQKVIEKRNKPQGDNKNDFAFLGLAKCAECNSAITAEKHYKFYPKTRSKVRYDYYRCGKNHGPCSQKYVPANDFEKQIRDIVFNASLHPENAKWLLN